MKDDDNSSAQQQQLRTESSRESQDSLMRSSADTFHSQRSSKRKGSEWEILGNLEKGVAYTIKPKKHDGYLHKRRKWPLRGWHRRYFLMEKGYFTYAKTEACLLYTSPSPRDGLLSRMPSSA